MNEQQRAAVMFADGVLQLIAGPGSGKTFVLTHRIQYLIEQYHVKPEQILVITFTKTAALEMEARFRKITYPNQYPVNFGTFHSVFYQFLKNDPFYKKVSIISEREKRQFIVEILLQMNLKDYTDDESVIQILRMISLQKNALGEISFSEYAILSPEQFEKLYSEYGIILKSQNKIDFDDMLKDCRLVLRSNPSLLLEIQKTFSYVLIDEFQDINSLQYEIIRMLTARSKNLFVVGDDDQSIYGFRGANPDIMKKFMVDFPEASQIIMAKNYRSSGAIIKTANKMIAENKNRFLKKIDTPNAMGEAVQMITYESVHKQLMGIIELIKSMDPLKNVAILFRTNHEADDLCMYLRKENILYERAEREKNPLSYFLYQDIFAYFDFVYDRPSRGAFLHLMNKPVRYIKRDACQKDVIILQELLNYYHDNYRMQDTLRALFKDLNYLKQRKPYLAYQYIRKVMGYDQYVFQKLSYEKWQVYLEKAEWLNDFLKQNNDYGQIKAFRQQIEHNASAWQDEPAHKKSNIKIMTYHGSKGLEFDHVIIPNVIEGKVPPRKSREEAQIEEERRMFYVAMTRAKEKLTITMVKNDKETPSRFLKNLL